MTSRATLDVTRRDEPHFHLGRRSSSFAAFEAGRGFNPNLSDGTWTRRCSHPTWMQHKLLRWSMATEEQQPTAEPVRLTHTLLQTHTFRLHTLTRRCWNAPRGESLVNDFRWLKISWSRWPTGSQPSGRHTPHIRARWQQRGPGASDRWNGFIFAPTGC